MHMKNRISLIFIKLLRPFFLFPLFFSACQNNNSTDSKEAEWVMTPWLAAFVHVLPHNKPAVCMQLLEDSVKRIDDQAWFCEGIMFNAFDTQNKDIYMVHLDNFEALSKGRFRALGKKVDNFSAKIDMFRGYKYRESVQYDSAFFFLNRSLKKFQEVKDTTFIYEALNRIANTYLRQGNYVAATDVTFQMMNYIKDDVIVYRAKNLYELSFCYYKSGDTEKAKTIGFEALALAKTTPDTLLISGIYDGLSNYFIELQQGDSALWAVQNGLYWAETKNSTDRLGWRHLNLGGAYKILKDFPKALAYSQSAFVIFDSLQNKGFSTSAMNQIANCYQAMGDWQNAKKYYAKTLNHLDSFKKTNIKIRIYDSLTVLAFQERNDIAGLNTLRTSKAYHKKQFSTERQQIVENMNVRYETALRQEQINSLNKDNKTLQLQLLIGFLLFGSALGFSGWFVHQNRQRAALVVKENELLVAKEQATQLELIANRQQLDAFTANILSKNQLISDLEANVSELSLPIKTPIDEDDEENREILANMKILTDSDWKTYLKYFTQVHKDFMTRINRDLSELSAAELRLFVLLKQGFNTKDMADVLGISIAGIKKSRHRLRKKLNLTEEDNLETFVQGF
jgi:tetratricopeptide (TPR) repeat protein/DNA-binding CsgD family transcriptional regulator